MAKSKSKKSDTYSQNIDQNIRVIQDEYSRKAEACLRLAPLGTACVDRILGFIALSWNGEPAYRLRKANQNKAIRIVWLIWRLFLYTHLVFIISSSLSLIFFKTVNPAATTLMLYRKCANGWKIQKPRYLSLSKIPKTTLTMTVRVEDGSFYDHHGILLSAMKNAYQLNKRFGEPVYGGSTITMQTARTIFLIPNKSYVRKYLGVIIALEMEVILGKERILELYFNYAEWGKGIFGIDAAARYHYKAGVSSLSRIRRYGSLPCFLPLSAIIPIPLEKTEF
ncbi:hypothetical protein MASR2M78_11590 [Treponema sp.]